MPKKLKLRYGMTPTQWDNLCLRCGTCCILGDGKSCDHLVYRDDGTTRCLIYSHAKSQWAQGKSIPLRGDMYCLPIEYAVHRARDCPYGKFFKLNGLKEASEMVALLEHAPVMSPAQVQNLKAQQLRLIKRLRY